MEQITIMSFLTSRLLKQLGFRKESVYYYVKPKQSQPRLFCIRPNNFLQCKHCDWNRYPKYLKSFGKPWKHYGLTNYPLFKQFDEDGEICTCPNKLQVLDFMAAKDIPLYPNGIFFSLLRFYRESRKQPNAFKKMEQLYRQQAMI